ncbi:hypothetical protein CkaCkLH20_02076 [Colletotrichum karsti]|uniref:Uncharacterized protein n=1 Tax=Colletotrichum karsti TaxID=1095194 RepID=A0A9P6IB14_9PEZI|nr:uncharacterized protein CkaCkLH20_02076 [Colletotrichum karsti]KAF9880122.1 hypothetical protein CkaCkLH20_02076 [Colletotrichum karsti]
MDTMLTFMDDVHLLKDPTFPVEEKRRMLDILLDHIIPYRFRYEPRVYPDLSFYATLLNNRDDFLEIWALVVRFYAWISVVAIKNWSMADEAANCLMELRQSLGYVDIFAQYSDFDPLSLGDLSPLSIFDETPGPAGQEEPSIASTAATRNDIAASDSEDPWLAAELEKPATLVYEGVIRNLDHFLEVDKAYKQYVKRRPGLTPGEDSSWPQTPEKTQDYIHTMYNAITNMDDFFELRRAKQRLAKVEAKKANNGQDTTDDGSRKRKRTATGRQSQGPPKGVQKSDWELLDDTSTPAQRLNIITHHQIKDVEIEILCWRLLVAAQDCQRGHTMKPLWSGTRTVSTWDEFETFGQRWSVMCNEIQFVRFASAPKKERDAKLANDMLNARRNVQNQIGLQEIQKRTANNEWTTAEDFEIRTRDGELVHEGSRLGDRERRELARR